MNGFIRIPNNLFKYKLSPAATLVYCAMLSRANSFKSLCVTYAELSVLCRMSPKTIRCALNELYNKRLAAKSNRYNSRGYLANRYTLTVLSGKWFMLPREVFDTEINPSAFLVYIFILSCKCNKRGGAFPSITSVCEAIGLSRGTVCKAIQYLHSYTFLNRLHRHYQDTNAYRHNRYIEFEVKEERPRNSIRERSEQMILTVNNNFKISHFFKIVKRFLTKKVKRCRLSGAALLVAFLRVVHKFPNSS